MQGSGKGTEWQKKKTEREEESGWSEEKEKNVKDAFLPSFLDRRVTKTLENLENNTGILEYHAVMWQKGPWLTL